MKLYRGAEGGQRVWFDNTEIEDIVEDELRKSGLMPTEVAPIVGIERFLEEHLRVDLDQHAPLDASILGVTEFRPKLPPKVAINRDLTGSALDSEDWTPGLHGRWRATLAHEGSHVLLHRFLYEVNAMQGSFLVDDPSAHDRLFRCLKRAVTFQTSKADWREVQANRGMAALLMPRSLFSRLCQEEAEALAIDIDGLISGSTSESQLASRLSALLAVSRQAATIRLHTLAVAKPRGSLTMPL